MISVVGDLLSIICALINAYRPLFIQDMSKDDEIADAVIASSHESNKLKDYVENMKEQSHSQLKWILINAKNAIWDFARLTLKQLNSITLEIYQMKQARCYTIDHIRQDGTYIVKVAKQRANLLRAQIQSRHRNAVSYNIFIQYNNTSILAWYCTCPCGTRVVGHCSHVCSVLWYLSIARHDSKLLRQRSASYLDQIIDAQDCSDVPSSDSDNSDDDNNTNVLHSLA